jgi:hypothetical protein
LAASVYLSEAAPDHNINGYTLVHDVGNVQFGCNPWRRPSGTKGLHIVILYFFISQPSLTIGRTNTTSPKLYFSSIPFAPNTAAHKVRMYKEYHSVCPSSELGLSQTSECAPPPEPGGGLHSPAGEGLEESQFYSVLSPHLNRPRVRAPTYCPSPREGGPPRTGP